MVPDDVVSTLARVLYDIGNGIADASNPKISRGRARVIPGLPIAGCGAGDGESTLRRRAPG